MPEKDYLAIAKKLVSRPKDKVGYRKILVYGRNKKGKTTFSLSAGVANTLVLDPEDGTDAMKTLNPYRWPIRDWEDLADAYGALRTGRLSPSLLGVGPEKEPFTWVSVDGLTRMNNMALHYVRRKREERDLVERPGMIDRRDYGKSGELMKGFLLNMHAMPVNVCFTAQERQTGGFDDEAEGEGEGIAYVPDLPASVRTTANALVEVIARIYTAKAQFKGKDGMPVEKMQRRLWIAPSTSYDTGYRSDFELPDFIKNPTLPKLTQLMLTGSEREG